MKFKLGCNLRLEYIDEWLGIPNPPPLLEIVPDNWLSQGPHWKKLNQIREKTLISCHCLGLNLAGYDPISDDYLRWLKAFVDKYQPSLVSDHLAVQAHGGVRVHDLLPFPMTASNLRRIANRIDAVQNYLGREILVENLAAYQNFSINQYAQSEFLNQLTISTGCSILLDLQNAYTNNKNGIESLVEFLTTICRERVAELHIASGTQKDEWLIDTHSGRPNETIIYLAREFPGLPIILEWDQHPPNANQMIHELQKISLQLDEPCLTPKLKLDTIHLTMNKHSTKKHFNDFFTALTTLDKFEESSGMIIYQHGYVHTHVSTITRLFPTVEKCLGAKNLQFFAKEYLKIEPPKKINLDLYGYSFPSFLSSRDELAALPIVFHIAAIDWFWFGNSNDHEILEVPSGTMAWWQYYHDNNSQEPPTSKKIETNSQFYSIIVDEKGNNQLIEITKESTNENTCQITSSDDDYPMADAKCKN